jgi:hypothetical protein
VQLAHEQFKILYAQAAKPGITRAHYVSQWREHGAVAMMSPDYWDGVDVYVQADTLAQATLACGGDASYFGVGELCYRTDADRRKGLTAPSRESRVVPHGHSIWAHPRPISVHCRSAQVFRRRKGAVKLYAFLIARQLGREAFGVAWREAAVVHGEALAACAGACSYEMSTPLDDSHVLHGVDEFEFDDVGAALRFANQDYAGVVQRFATSVSILTAKVELYSRSNYGDPTPLEASESPSA